MRSEWSIYINNTVMCIVNPDPIYTHYKQTCTYIHSIQCSRPELNLHSVHIPVKCTNGGAERTPLQMQCACLTHWVVFFRLNINA